MKTSVCKLKDIGLHGTAKTQPPLFPSGDISHWGHLPHGKRGAAPLTDFVHVSPENVLSQSGKMC